MGTLTLEGIRDLVRQDLNETTQTRITDTELNAIINDGYKDAAVKGLGRENKISFSNINAEKIYPLYGNHIIRATYVEYKTEGTQSGKGLMCALPQVFGYVPLSGSAPQYWFQWGEALIIEPVPDAATYDLEVYSACYPSTVLSADGDIPSSLPVEFYESIYFFAVAFACLKLKRWSDAALGYNRYIEDIQRKRMEYISKYPDTRVTHNIPDAVEEKSEQ